MSLRGEDRPAKIAWQRRPELWNVFRQPRVIARQSGETVGGGLRVGVIEFRREPGAPALLQGEKGQPENGGDGNARERNQHAAREPRHLRALGPQPQFLGELLFMLRRAHIAGLPSLRTIRTTFWESAPKRSSAAANSRSTIM